MKFLDSKQNSNSFYMVLEKLLITILNFFVFASVARLLGAEALGLFTLTQAVMLIGWPIALFVNDQVLIRTTLDESLSSNKTYKHAVVLKLFFAMLTYLVSILFAYLLFGTTVATYVSIFCLIHIINFDILFFSYFRAHRNSKTVFCIKLLVAIPFALLKILVLLSTSDLMLLFATYVTESFVLGISSTVAFLKDKENKYFLSSKLSSDYFSKLVKPSLPLLCSAVVITMYSRIDQFMIKSILGNAELGQYAVGVKLSEASTILFGAYIASQFPRLIKAHNISRKYFDTLIVKNLQLSLVLGLSMLITVYFFSDQIIALLFGADYTLAGDVLLVHMIGAIFIYYGMICTQWLIAEKLEYYRLLRVIFGLCINVVLNIFWIERYGIVGAAWATVLSQVGSNLLFNAIAKQTMPFFRLEMLSFNLITLFKKNTQNELEDKISDNEDL